MALGVEFGAALSLADVVVVLDVYPAREQPVGELAGVSGLRVAQAAAEWMGGRPVWWLPEADSARRALVERLDGGDWDRTSDGQEPPSGDPVLVTIGAGDVFKLGESLVEGEA
jgi:UDP-N-acetylmuramate--alanine ligase